MFGSVFGGSASLSVSPFPRQSREDIATLRADVGDIKPDSGRSKETRGGHGGGGGLVARVNQELSCSVEHLMRSQLELAVTEAPSPRPTIAPMPVYPVREAHASCQGGLTRALSLAVIALFIAACGPLHTALGSPTTPPTLSFSNPNIVPGLERGTAGHLVVEPASTNSSPAVTATKAKAIALADAPHFVGFGPPVQAVLVEITITPGSGASFASSFPSPYPRSSSSASSFPNPCLCWVVDMTPSTPGKDPVHGQYPVTFAAYVIDAQTGAILERVTG